MIVSAVPSRPDHATQRPAFTLIELLVVVSIIALLISMLMPSLGRARDQAKGVHCLARLKDIGTGLASYENVYEDAMPPAEWFPDFDNKPNLRYGWSELLFEWIYKEKVYRPDIDEGACPEHFPVQRNTEQERFAKYFICKASPMSGVNSGHYRVYLPFWSGGTSMVNASGVYTGSADPRGSGRRASLSPKAVLLGDANERSIRGSGDMPPETSTCRLGDDCSYIDAGEANEAGPNGFDGNRFSDRHYGGTNYLFQDLHGEWSTSLRNKLARDFDLNGIPDIATAP